MADSHVIIQPLQNFRCCQSFVPVTNVICVLYTLYQQLGGHLDWGLHQHYWYQESQISTFYTHFTSVYFLATLVLLHLNEDIVLLVLLLHLPTIRATHGFQSFIISLVSDFEILLVRDHVDVVL